MHFYRSNCPRPVVSYVTTIGLTVPLFLQVLTRLPFYRSAGPCSACQYCHFYRSDCTFIFTGLTVPLFLQVWLYLYFYRSNRAFIFIEHLEALCLNFYRSDTLILAFIFTGLTVPLFLQVWPCLYFYCVCCSGAGLSARGCGELRYYHWWRLQLRHVFPDSAGTCSACQYCHLLGVMV